MFSEPYKVVLENFVRTDPETKKVRKRGNPLQAAEHIDTPTSRQITHTEMRFKGPDHSEMAPLTHHPSMMSNLPPDYEHFIGHVTDGFFSDGELKLQRSEDNDVLNHPRLKTEIRHFNHDFKKKGRHMQAFQMVSGGP
jgi:hypothetical protein